ncbi:MAG TPA: AAA family ATPase [Pseudomonadota bacterium]|nr:AAA family ATPase [Pseudomonadota bacterium]
MSQRLASVPATDIALPKGIHADISLPTPELGALWDSIVLDPATKQRLVGQAVLNFTLRRKVARTVLPLHGVILLVGPPGTGKTSLARGLANRTAESFAPTPFRLLEVEPHALTSSAMGKTQRAVSELFSQSVAESAERGATIVLLDEVETLAADRTKMSLDANPIDIHRATDAVLVQLDALASRFPDLLFIATSNFPGAVDSAFTSRCDLVIEVPLPDAAACRQILVECLTGLGATYPGIAMLAKSSDIAASAKASVGLDGRAIRKTVAAALGSSLAVALDPNKLTLADLESSLLQAKTSRSVGGLVR